MQNRDREEGKEGHFRGYHVLSHGHLRPAPSVTTLLSQNYESYGYNIFPQWVVSLRYAGQTISLAEFRAPHRHYCTTPMVVPRYLPRLMTTSAPHRYLNALTAIPEKDFLSPYFLRSTLL
jgi:hypothetical protein